MKRPTAARAGLTLLELIIAGSILSLILVNSIMISRAASTAARSGAFTTQIEDELNQTLERIALAVMSSDTRNLYPRVYAPNFTPELTYSVSLGMQDGEVVTGAPERIQWSTLGDSRGQVRWFENPGMEGERSAVWSNWVPALQIDEEINGIDDNGNGLPDEQGLAFDIDNDRVNIHLTVSRLNPNGDWYPVQRRLNITCRN